VDWAEVALTRVGPVGLAVGFAFWTLRMIFRGFLVPRSYYLDIKEERDTWKNVALKAVGQVDDLLEYARTADSILKSLPRGGGQQ
jgi:hypothetical protein